MCDFILPLGAVVDSPLRKVGSEWGVSGINNCRMTAQCIIHLAERYSLLADKQGFSLKVTMESHATALHEVNLFYTYYF